MRKMTFDRRQAGDLPQLAKGRVLPLFSLTGQYDQQPKRRHLDEHNENQRNDDPAPA